MDVGEKIAIGVTVVTVLAIGMTTVALSDEVRVLRGSVHQLEVTEQPNTTEEGRTVVGGERVWVLDPNTNTLVGCRLINTSRVGGQDIRCSEKRFR